MKNKSIYFVLCLLCVFSCNQGIYACDQSNVDSTRTDSFSDLLNSINICRWKGGCNTCLSMSFDDSCISQKQISEIFDQYGFKASFFIIPSNLNKWYSLSTDNVNDILKRGHEIGNHTYTHTLEFDTETDVSKIDSEIRKAKEFIDKKFNIKCVSFADPYHQNSPLSRNIVFKYNLFSRDYSEYYTFNRLSIDSTLRINKVMSYVKKGIKTNNILIMSGHGIDNDGYSPIKKDFLVQMLDSVKKYVDNGQLWITTLKDGEQYDNLFREIKVMTEMSGDTIKIRFKNYKREKYIDLDKSPLSVELPLFFKDNITILSDSVELKEFSDKIILTLDLKKDTTLTILTNKLKKQPNLDTVSNNLIVISNPANSIVYIRNINGLSSIEIYDLNGKLLIKKLNNISEINVSQLKSGLYILKVEIKTYNSISSYNYKLIIHN